jgi:hypothetical protein
MKRFSDYPTVKVIPRKTGDKIFLLTETIGYRTAVLDDYPNIIIYKGFESDGASVPRVFSGPSSRRPVSTLARLSCMTGYASPRSARLSKQRTFSPRLCGI